MGERPAFHSPRSLRSLTRSKRLRTERLPPTVALDLRLLCLDIVMSGVNRGAGTVAWIGVGDNAKMVGWGNFRCGVGWAGEKSVEFPQVPIVRGGEGC